MIINQINSQQLTPNRPDINSLTQFFDKFIKKINSLKISQQHQPTNQFAKGIYNVLRVKQISQTIPSKATRASSLNDLKLQIGKLSLLLPSLTTQIKQEINEILKGLNNGQQIQASTFFLNQIQQIDNFLKKKITNEKFKTSKELDIISNRWMGQRLGVQLPSKGNSKTNKLIQKQLLNYGNMLIESYSPYYDWHQKIQNSYDKLNYMIKPSLKSQELFKTHYLKFPSTQIGQTCLRKVPTGIFPDANRKRVPLSPPNGVLTKGLQQNASTPSYFAKQPFKYMLMKDRIDSREKQVTDETLLMVSLLNYRNALKKNCRDQQIISSVLGFNFYQNLISEHIKNASKNLKKNAKYLPRNPTQFRLFQQSMKDIINQKLDCYSDFFLKQAGRRQYQNILKNKMEGQLKNNEVSKSKIQEKLQDYYLKLQSLDRDNYSVSLIRQEESVVKYNLQSLLKPINRRTLSQDLIQEVYGKANLTDQMYLNISRRYSQMKLIKARILSKIYKSQKLSDLEVSYLKQWKSQIRQIVGGKGYKSLRSLHFTMMPETETSLTIGDLKKYDIERFSKYPLVGLRNQKLREFSLSEVCLELGNFINSGTLKRVEIEFMGEMMKDQWKLEKKYQVCNARNYQVDLIMTQMEERVWRDAGRFSETDYQSVKKMTNIKRGSGDVDRVFVRF